MKTVIGIVLTVWFGLVCVLGASGFFVVPAAAPPFPILTGACVPLAVFFGLLVGSGGFRRALQSSDVALITSLHAWRTGGLGFLALAAHGVLPDSFAQPAGWGDIAIGVTAPWFAIMIARRPGFAGGRLFAVWNVVGILDLVVAVGMGVLSSGFVPWMAGDVTTGPMASLPLVVIPTFFVPLYIMLHVTAMITARQSPAAHSARATKSVSNSLSPTPGRD